MDFGIRHRLGRGRHDFSYACSEFIHVAVRATVRKRREEGVAGVLGAHDKFSHGERLGGRRRDDVGQRRIDEDFVIENFRIGVIKSTEQI